MKPYQIFKRMAAIIPSIMAVFLLSACEDFLEPETPLNQVEEQYVFTNENTATAAVTTLYGKLRDQGFLSGSLYGDGLLMGLYADELDYYFFPGFDLESFYLHQVIPSNTALNDLWNVPYNIIYSANAVLEGLEASSSLPPEVKSRLRGEALFVRGLCHFSLVNYFGDVPYIKTTDYTNNTTVAKQSSQEVYEAIVVDLLEAQNLLGEEYIGNERVRPNSPVVTALLAKVYLYREEWDNAAAESSKLINNTALYTLESDINSVFLKESASTIWQFKPRNEGDNTLEGSNFILTYAPPFITALNPNLVMDMEEGDLRRINWIGEVSDGTNVYFFPNKYKENENTGISVEYSKIFRLAEQYLIRAEARAMMGDLAGGQQDLNKVRNRAGLNNTEASTAEQLREAVITERRFELFTEFGNRWFDLKRTQKAEEILSPIKPGWKNTDFLLPIPEAEILANPNLNPQNQGY